MAKQPPLKGGTSRIRFIMLEAEIPEGDLTQITSAIQNALKPTTIVQQRLPSQPAPSARNGNGDDGENSDEAPIDVEAEQPTQEIARVTRVPRVRKPSAPKVLQLDLTNDVSLETFANKHRPESHPERNLVVGAYFKEHRGEDSITADHVYTCYRAMKWPTGIEDFSWPLRHLRKTQFMSSPSRGQFAINHLGLARVQKLGSE